LGALGIWEGIKRWILSRVDENIEQRKLDTQQKRQIRDDIFNFIAQGQSSSYTYSPTSQDLAKIYKIIYELQQYKKDKISSELEDFIFNWQLFIYLKGKKMAEMRNTVKEKLDKLAKLTITKVNSQL